MKNKYKASFTKLNNLNNQCKFDSCMLTISVGQQVHEGEKFKATLELINNNFKKCTIGVCDTLQRHSLAILADLKSQDLHNISKQAGDQWIDRNIEYCEEILKIPFKLKRWDEWLQNDKYYIFKKQIDQLYQKDSEFVNIVNNLAIEFTDRLRKRGHSFNLTDGTKLCTDYLLEECAAMCQWYEEKYNVEIYPAVRNKAIEYGFKSIMQNQYGKLVLPAGVNFKKINNRNYHTSEIAIKKVFDIIPGHIYWKDLDGTFLGCNKRQAENYGFKDEASLIGKKDADLLKANVAKEIQANDKKIITRKLEEIIEEDTYILFGKKRVKKTFLSHKMPLFESGGKVIGIVGISIDISEQKKLQQNLIKKTKELSSALDHKRKFLNVLSHEIRTPLHIMGSIIDELYKSSHSFSKEELDSFIEVLSENNKRLMKLLTNLLESAKNIQNQDHYFFKKDNIVNTCINCIKEFHTLADINFVCDDTKELIVSYDEIKINQVIRNIIDNAIKYGISKKINVILKVSEDFKDIIVKVENKGKKIKEEERDKLFVMFYQGTQGKKMQNGVGLGLSICQEIIHAHKGKVLIENTVYDKVSVNFTIPYSG